MSWEYMHRGSPWLGVERRALERPGHESTGASAWSQLMGLEGSRGLLFPPTSEGLCRLRSRGPQSENAKRLSLSSLECLGAPLSELRARGASRGVSTPARPRARSVARHARGRRRCPRSPVWIRVGRAGTEARGLSDASRPVRPASGSRGDPGGDGAGRAVLCPRRRPRRPASRGSIGHREEDRGWPWEEPWSGIGCFRRRWRRRVGERIGRGARCFPRPRR